MDGVVGDGKEIAIHKTEASHERIQAKDEILTEVDGRSLGLGRSGRSRPSRCH